jgi:hypothetical protein
MGFFILTPEGKVKYHISQNKGLSNNTVLSLFEDADKKPWVDWIMGLTALIFSLQKYVDRKVRQYTL